MVLIGLGYALVIILNHSHFYNIYEILL